MVLTQTASNIRRGGILYSCNSDLGNLWLVPQKGAGISYTFIRYIFLAQPVAVQSFFFLLWFPAVLGHRASLPCGQSLAQGKRAECSGQNWECSSWSSSKLLIWLFLKLLPSYPIKSTPKWAFYVVESGSMTAHCSLSMMMIFVAERPGWPEALGFLLVSLGLFFLMERFRRDSPELGVLGPPAPLPCPEPKLKLHFALVQGWVALWEC